MTTGAVIMKQYLLQRVCPPRPASAPPSKALSCESESGSETGGGGEEERNSLSVINNSVPQTHTKASNNKNKKKKTLLKTLPETPPSTTITTTPTKIPTTNTTTSYNNNNGNKSRNNKRKAGSKKQQHEYSRSDYHHQGSAEKPTTAAFSTDMQAAGLLIVDGASRPRNARNGTAGDGFPVENPSAAEDSQAAAPKPEPAPKETPRRNKKLHVSPGHGTNPQYGSHHDMPMYMGGVQEGYYNEQPLRQEYPATYVQHPNAYPALSPQQGFPPPPLPYQPRFDQMRFDSQQFEQARFEQHQQQRYEQQQRPISYRGGYAGYQRYHNHHHHRHSHHHQGMSDHRDDGPYYANHAQSGYSGYTPPRSHYHNAHWHRSRQVSADEERVSRRSPPYPPISPPRTVTAAVVEDDAGFESVAVVVQPKVQDEGDAGPEAKSAEQVESKPDLSATPARVDTKLDTIVESVVEQVETKPELGFTAEESTIRGEKLDIAEKNGEKPAEKPEELAVSFDSDATLEIDAGLKDTTVESDINTEVVSAEPSNVSPEAITEKPATTLAPEELVIHDSETETLQASPRAVSPGDSPHQVIQHHDSLIVHFTAIDMAESLPLASHLVSVFTNRTYSDVEIALNSPDNNWISGKFPAHRVIVAQSPVLDSILNRREAMDGKLRMELIAGKRFSMLRSFDCALQSLYGLPLLEFDDISKHTRLALSWGGVQNDQVPAHITALELDFLIGYMVAGAFMNVERIALNGFRIMQDYTHWCNLETAFHFGLYPEDFLIMYVEMEEESQGKKGGKGSKGKGRKKLGELPPMAEPLNRVVIGNFAPRIATLVAKWLVENMPTNFAFDRTAYTTRCLKDRIPSKLLTGTRSSGSPAPTATELAGLETGRRAQPSVAHRLISGILLALPFAQLHETAGLLRREGMLTAKLVREVLQEREQRRIRALREYVNKQPNKKVRDVPASHVVLGYREFAVHFETRDMLDEHMQEIRHDFTLHREWVGYQTGGEAEPVLEKFRE